MKVLHNLFIVSVFLIVIFSFIGVIAVDSSLIVSDDSYPLANPKNELGVEASAGVLNNDPSRSEISLIYLTKNTSKGQLYELNNDGSFTYFTDSNIFHGVDYFDYIASDGFSNSSSARVWIGVNNSIPVVSDDSYPLANPKNELGVEASAGVLNNDDGDADSDAITLLLVKNTAHGVLFEFNQDGSFTYYTDSNTFHGVDYFDYVLSDGYSNSSSARVVLGVNDSAPVALQDKYIIASSVNTTNATGSMANDYDSDSDQMLASLVENVHFGKLKTSATGFSVNGSFNYTSNKSNGVDFFSYYLTDLYLNSKTVNTIFVIGTNTAPVANADIYNYNLSTKNLSVNASLGVLANDNDAEKDILFAELVNDSNLNGTLHFNQDGSFVYYPKTGFAGVESFTYQVTDLDMNSSVASVRIYVNYSGIENLTDTMDNQTDSGDNITINFTSEVYPLTFLFKLYNESNSTVSQSENNTANESDDLPGIFTFPANLPTGQYSLYLYVYDVSGDLVNETFIGVTNYTAPSQAPQSGVTSSGGGGSRGICTTTWSCTEWSACNAGSQTRTCSYPANNCAPRVTKPLVSQTCTMPAAPTNNTQTETDQTTQPSFTSLALGNVIGTTAGRWSLGVVLFLILVGLAWWIIAAKKRRAANKPVKIVKMSAVKKKK